MVEALLSYGLKLVINGTFIVLGIFTGKALRQRKNAKLAKQKA